MWRFWRQGCIRSHGSAGCRGGVVLALIVAVVLLYTLVAGAEPPVVRSAVLVVIICLGAWAGRRGAAFNSLAAAAILVLALESRAAVPCGHAIEFLVRGDSDLVGADAVVPASQRVIRSIG